MLTVKDFTYFMLDNIHYSYSDDNKVVQLLLFEVKPIDIEYVFIMHNTYRLYNTLYKDVFIAENKNKSLNKYAVHRTECFDIDHQYPDHYEIIEDFNLLNRIL